MSKSLHFTIGEGYGQIITDIAQEHIHCHHNLTKALAAIEQSIIGIPRKMALDVISGKKVIMVEEGEDASIVITERNIGHDALGYHEFNANTWSDKEVEKLVKSGTDLAETLDRYIDELRNKRNGHVNIDFDASSLMKYIFNGDDSDLLLEIEEELDVYTQMGRVVDSYMEKADKVLLCLKELYQLSNTDDAKGKPEWVVDIPPTLQVVINIKFQIKQLTEIKRFKEGYEIVAEQIQNRIPSGSFEGSKAANLLDDYLDAQKDIDKVANEGIEAIDIADDYSACWLAPNGDCYGLNGEIANMLHNQIGDMLIKAGIIDVGDKNEQAADSFMMAEGWLKIHNGGVLGDHVYHEILITQEQKDALIRYSTVRPQTVLYMNHDRQFISKARLEMTELGALTNMLDYGMRKEGKAKQSIKNIRKDPNFGNPRE